MDTNRITQDTEKIFRAVASDRRAMIRMGSSALRAARIGLAAAALVASAGMAAAQERYPVGAAEYYGLSGRQAPSLSSVDHIRYDRSGTRGRDGLGESPFHPEGPGDPSD